LAVEGLNLPEGFELSLYDQDGKLLKEMRSNANGNFLFVLLTPYEYRLERYDNKDESILSIDILGRFDAYEVPEQGFQIILLDSSGATIGNTYTSDSGEFAFRSVSPNDTYIIKSEVSDANSAIHIVDKEGNVINTIQPDENNQYVYVRLGAGDKIITLTNELKQKVKISESEQFEIGSVYFDLNAAEIDQKAARSLAGIATILTDNPHVNVEMSGHTDSRGTAAYNEKLSQQRIEAVLQFLSREGVETYRIKGKGYGESRIKNKCADGVPCSEEEHAENRRTEFRLYQTEKNQ
jgi:outer membrane protein OmpA-like peptidoglycan-associated protein